MKKSRLFGLDRLARHGKRSASSLRQSRRATFETLENRWVLSGLSPISPVTLTPGGSYLVPLLDSDTGPISFTATPANTANVTASVLTTTSLLKMTVHGVNADNTLFSGEMDFLLFGTIAPQTVARITTLANSGFYNHGATASSPMTFHRIIQDFMIQGGDPAGDGTGGSGTTIPDEFSTEILFTQSGILAMASANNASATPPVTNTGDSQFFVTAGPTPSLNSQYTIFGMLIAGDDIRKKIAAVSVVNNGQGEVSKPVSPPVIDSVSVVSDTHDAVLHVKLASAATGTTAVNVTPSTGASQSFNVVANTPPVLANVADISTVAGTAVNITLSGTDVDNNPLVYGGLPSDTTKLTLNLGEDGHGTLTPNASAVGLYNVLFGVTDDNGTTWTTQYVPVFVSPTAPTSVQFLAPAGQTGGFTSLNNTGGKTLQFQVSGVVAGTTVTVYADGTAIGTATVATGATSVVVTTNNSTVLQDGAHSITVKQSYHYAAATVGTRSIAAGDLVSTASATPLQLTVDTVMPHITSTANLAASANQQYVYQPTTDSSGQTLVFTLTTKPTGMAVDGSTGRVTWTPQPGQGPTQAVVLHVTDQAGNATDQSFTVQVNDDLNQYNRNPVVNLPTGVGDNRVTVRRHGDNVEVFDNRANATLLTQPLTITYSLTVVCADGVANTVTIDFAYGGNLPISNGVTVRGDTNPGNNNTLVIHGSAAADTFQTASTSTSNTVVANGLTTTFSAINKLQLEGGSGNDTYALGGSPVNVAVIDTAGTDTLDFSAASAGIQYSLKLDRGQTQTIAPWGKTLAVTGVVENLTGTNFADTLTGGNGATSIVRGLGGNDTLRGGSRYSVLLGGDGNDVLYAGLSNNVLIGGAGADTLNGGTRENILIGGTTNWDNNNQALATAVQKGAVPAMIGAKVLSFVATKHTTTATSLTSAAASAAMTVQEDSVKDYLFGGRGGHNWFLPGKNDMTKT